VTDGHLAPLAFSTLACPEWDAETILAKALAFGFDGIEWRGGPDGTVRTGWTTARRRALRIALDRAGVSSTAVTSYTELISGDAAERARSVAEIVEHVELASDLGAPAVRVFLGARDDDAGNDELDERAVAGLAQALRRTRASEVAIAIEPHDDHVRSEQVRPILDAIPDPRLRVVWDIANAWSAGEAPPVGLAAYEGRIAYVQVKDGTGRGATWQLCELGTGEVPLEDALERLAGSARAAGKPVPPISVEWERAWHPELALPDVALPAARGWLADRLARIAGPAGSLDRSGEAT
jgi:sugar phosphate isomerase/epimerase